MSNRRSNVITSKSSRTNANSNKTTTNNQLSKRIQITKVVPPRKAKKEQQNDNNTQKIKVDYNSSNYFYSNENENSNNNNEDERYVEYYEQNQKDQKYNHETSDSYITVEQEDGNFKNVPKYYMEYNRRNSPFYKKDNYEYYEENSGEYENEEGDNDEMYYENDEEFEQDEIEEQQSPKKNYTQYQNVNKYYVSQSNKESKQKNIIQKVSQNVISRPIRHQINYAKDLKRKSRTSGRLNNYGNNSTTTNNTYNNNIYYINPVNVKEKKSIEDQRIKKPTNKKNAVYKNVDITINKRKSNKEKDYFRSHNIDKSQRNKYIKSAILIQSIFRSYLIKMKLYNSVNLYICVKHGIFILEKVFLKTKSFFWNKYKKYISNINDIFVNINLLRHYLRNNTRNNSTDKKYISFHKELGDSFNIINKRENSEKKLKSKLNDVIKENTELKNQLVDNKNIEEKIKNLIDENKKNQNINAIIMKDNQQLAKKLKDFQDYRNTNLIVQNQSSLDLTQKDLFEIDELIKNNEIYKNKLKGIYLANVINKKISDNKYIKKDIFDKLKNTIEKIKEEDKEKNMIKKIYVKNLVYIMENHLKLTKLNCFKKLYYTSILSFQEKKSKDNLKNESLKKILIKINQIRKNILLKSFLKIYYNNASLEKTKPEKETEDIKSKLLKKIFNNFDTNRKSILKVFSEKWNLTSKILGMRAAARDKKKKRKLKKKNNKLISQKHFGLVDKTKENKNNLTNQFCKSIHEFSYIVSNGAIIKESSSNEPGEINIKNNKCSISSDKINKKFNKNVGLKKVNSVNEINITNSFKKDTKDNIKEKTNSNIEESDEDSGDSLGLGNNSD